ncbi:MAG: tetraacyldisaccharide 4'-kinase [Pseudomonadota bacterium]
MSPMPSMKRRLAVWVERRWYGSPGLLWLLFPLELLYVGLSAVRRALYRSGILSSDHPGVPVIVVGNVTAGGSGKTPCVRAIADHLLDAGLRPAIVSRGHGGTDPGPRAVRSDDDARQVGDEALMLARTARCKVVIGRDRAAAARIAVEQGANTVVCDDGLQHYALARDIEIIAIDGTVGLGSGRRIPVGPLREAPARLDTADFILERNGRDPGTAVAYRPIAFRHCASGEIARPDQFVPKRDVHALAAIARPERFFNQLRDLGISITEHVYADHEVPPLDDLRKLVGRPLIITEKDEVKLPVQVHDDCWVLLMEADLPATFLPKLRERLSAAATRYDVFIPDPADTTDSTQGAGKVHRVAVP